MCIVPEMAFHLQNISSFIPSKGTSYSFPLNPDQRLSVSKIVNQHTMKKRNPEIVNHISNPFYCASCIQFP